MSIAWGKLDTKIVGFDGNVGKRIDLNVIGMVSWDPSRNYGSHDWKKNCQLSSMSKDFFPTFRQLLVTTISLSLLSVTWLP